MRTSPADVALEPAGLPGEADIGELTRSATSLRRFLHGLPGVDQVGAEARAATLATRSVKTTAKEYAIDLAIRMVDLTTLEGQDTPGKVAALATKAMRPDPSDPTCPAAAAVCVYADLVPVARRVLGDSGVKVAAVATAFPSGRASRAVKIADVEDAVSNGADEIEWFTVNAMKSAFWPFDQRLRIINELIKPGYALLRAARL